MPGAVPRHTMRSRPCRLWSFIMMNQLRDWGGNVHHASVQWPHGPPGSFRQVVFLGPMDWARWGDWIEHALVLVAYFLLRLRRPKLD